MSTNKGRHRRATRTEKVVAGATVMGVGLALPLTLTGNAQAADVSVWDKVAKCESSGNWSYNGSSGFDGGLQFLDSTWDAYKPNGYPASANQATKAQQIVVAEKVLASQGASAWPKCSVVAGLTTSMAEPHKQAATTQSIPKTTTPKATPVKASAKGDKAASYAQSQVGDAYVYGGNGPAAWDCSGLTQAAWKSAGISIPRTSQAQWSSLPKVSLNSLKPGDLIVFYSDARHIGIYVGNGKFVHAANPSKGVTTNTLKEYKSWGIAPIGAVRPTPYASASKAPTPKAAPVKPKAKKVEVPTNGKYTVKGGDTLSGISSVQLGSTNWKPLYEANKDVVGSNPNLIFPGQKLALPKASTKEPAKEEKVVEKTAPKKEAVKKTASVVAPVDGAKPGQGFKNPGNYSLGYHTGVDFSASQGTKVKAMTAGTVVKSDSSGSYGINVQIKHDDGTYSLYAHLSSKTVQPGARVTAGRLIGFVGSTGNSTGPHLHLEVRTAPTFAAGNFLDPLKWLADKGLTL